MKQQDPCYLLPRYWQLLQEQGTVLRVQCAHYESVVDISLWQGRISYAVPIGGERRMFPFLMCNFGIDYANVDHRTMMFRQE